MMPISELPMGIFEHPLDQGLNGKRLEPPMPQQSEGRAKAAARKLSGIMMDKWATTVQGKNDRKLAAIDGQNNTFFLRVHKRFIARIA